MSDDELEAMKRDANALIATHPALAPVGQHVLTLAAEVERLRGTSRLVEVELLAASMFGNPGYWTTKETTRELYRGKAREHIAALQEPPA